MGNSGFVPFFLETIFKDFSRSQIYFSTIPNFTLNPLIPKISKSILLTVYRYFLQSELWKLYRLSWADFQDFPELSRTFKDL